MSYTLGELTTLAPSAPVCRLVSAVLEAAPPDRVFGDLVRATVPGAMAVPALLAHAAALDAAPSHRSVASSARMALSLYDAHQEWSSVTDLEDDHGHDAAHRLVALAEVVAGLYDGAPAARATALFCSPAGRALAVWFAAVELAVAFLPADDPLGDHVGTALIDRWSDDLPARSPDVDGVLRELLPSLDGGAAACAAGASWIADALRAALPELADRSRDTLAAEPHALPVYRLLVARVIAERGGVDEGVDEGRGAAERAAIAAAEREAAVAMAEAAEAAEREAAERAAIAAAKAAEREAAERAAIAGAEAAAAAAEREAIAAAEREAAAAEAAEAAEAAAEAAAAAAALRPSRSRAC